MPEIRVLVIDDNLEMARTIAENLAQHGFLAEAVGGGAEGIARFSADPADVVLTDLRMKGAGGFDVLEEVKKIDPAVPVIIMTAFGAIDSAVEAIRRGAYHYVTKPFKLDVLRLFIERASADRAVRAEHRRLKALVHERHAFGNLVGGSPAMRQLYGLVERFAAVASPVLLLGETGTGKELIARAIHENGPRAAQPFVAVNCAALPEALLESELFGHARGAFTGATQARRGLFLEADGGTLLLDEIGDMPTVLQAKLLRVLETGEVRPVGSDTPRRVDVRIVAATHRALDALVREGKFREDLYFRLRVLTARLPPLRERREDLPLLLVHFLEDARRRAAASPVRAFSPEALRLVGDHPFPGNVRELRHLVESVVVTGQGEIVGADEVREAIAPAGGEGHPIDRAKRDLVPLRELERIYIEWVLERTGGNRTRAAEILGLDPSTLYRREVKGRS